MQEPAEGAARKLAAIMFTDIKGFSKKMAENEPEAFELLKMHDAIMRVLIAKFDGKVIKSIGDSFMVDFASAVNAVKCAVEAQKRFWNFNRDKNEFERVEIRIGIHLGDVLIRDDDMIGDGVNVASRIEAITDPTRICISQDVYQQVRNKMPLQVHSLGPLSLKNIPEPVEIFEILIDSIPELAKPSEHARRIAAERKAEEEAAQAAVREQEEAREAKRVEETRQRQQREKQQAEEDRKKKIEDHYNRAEEFVRQGKLEDAEHELAEVYKLDPQMAESAAQRKQEADSKEQQAGRHVARAKELFKDGKLDEAEAEVNEIFRVFPLHVAAQQMLQQIEDERYRLEEQARMRKTEAEGKRGPTEEEKKIEELLEKAHALLAQEEFAEATYTLRELFLLDPNHSGARRLEENIRQAEQARAELLRLQAQQEEEEKRRQEMERIREHLEERKRVIVQPPPRKRKINYRLYARIAGAVIVVIALAVIGPRMYRLMFPHTASVAVLAFAADSGDAVTGDLVEALPALLTEDLARCSHMTVVASPTALSYDPTSGGLGRCAASMGVRYLLAGTVQSAGDRLTVTVRLYDAEEQAFIFSRTVDGSTLALHKIRNDVVRAIVDFLEIETPFEPATQSTRNLRAFALYLDGIRFLQHASTPASLRAMQSLQEAVREDSSFAEAYALLSLAETRVYEDRPADADLASARDAAQTALRLVPGLPSAYLALGIYYRMAQQYDNVMPALNASLAAQPANADCSRELALFATMTGAFDAARRHVLDALALDPRNPRTHITQGILDEYEHRFDSAVSAFGQAIALGADDSLTTVRYLLGAWVQAGSAERAVKFCGSMLARTPEDYRWYYRIGRAYQFATRVSESQQWLERGLAIARNDADKNPRDAQPYASAALFLTRLGRFADGEAAMRHALEIAPGSVDLLYREADMYAIQKEKQKALQTLRDAIGKRFDFPEVLNPDFSVLSREPEFVAAISVSAAARATKE